MVTRSQKKHPLFFKRQAKQRLYCAHKGNIQDAQAKSGTDYEDFGACAGIES